MSITFCCSGGDEWVWLDARDVRGPLQPAAHFRRVRSQTAQVRQGRRQVRHAHENLAGKGLVRARKNERESEIFFGLCLCSMWTANWCPKEPSGHDIVFAFAFAFTQCKYTLVIPLWNCFHGSWYEVFVNSNWYRWSQIWDWDVWSKRVK